MAKLSSYRVLIAGILSAPIAALLGREVYRTLTRHSADRDADFVFRLSMTALAMAVPFVVTLALAIADRRRRNGLTTSGKVGLALACLSLGLTWLPIRGAVARARQTRSLGLHDVAAPPFDTVDVFGKQHRLADHAGEVVLVNVWATWCSPCRKEMPDLDRLYQKRKDDGLMVFGLSTEDLDTQRKFLKDVSVSYPLLTVAGNVPEVYRTTARFPANFLIDREGRLQPAPSTEQPFAKLEGAVDALLQRGR
jgi:thiol-disulfide isomerase/thioredoxin